MRPSSVAKTPQRVFSLSPYDGCFLPSLFSPIYRTGWKGGRGRTAHALNGAEEGFANLNLKVDCSLFEAQLESSWAFCAQSIAHTLLFAKKKLGESPLFHIFPLAPAIFIPFPPRAFPPLWQCAMGDPPPLRGEIPHAFASPPPPPPERGLAGGRYIEAIAHAWASGNGRVKLEQVRLSRCEPHG